MARLSKLAKWLVFIGIAYWIWTGPYQSLAYTPSVDDPKRNAQIIADCVAQGGFEDVDSYKGSGQTPESICADKNNLYMTYTAGHIFLYI